MSEPQQFTIIICTVAFNLSLEEGETSAASKPLGLKIHKSGKIAKPTTIASETTKTSGEDKGYDFTASSGGSVFNFEKYCNNT